MDFQAVFGLYRGYYHVSALHTLLSLYVSVNSIVALFSKEADYVIGTFLYRYFKPTGREERDYMPQSYDYGEIDGDKEDLPG
jgi:hypothetical protein